MSEEVNTSGAKVGSEDVNTDAPEVGSNDMNTGAAENETATVAETGLDNSSKTDGEILEKNERGDKTICNFKTIFCSVLLVLAIALVLFFYLRYRREKSKAFLDTFRAQVSQMELNIDSNVDAAFTSLSGLSISTTSVVKRLAEETDYPPGFINIPDVAQTLGEAKNTSNALVIAYVPKVLSENFELWKSYSKTHSSWIAEEQPGGPMNVTPEIIDSVWEFMDYNWEYSDRRLIDEIGDGMPRMGLRGNEPSRKLNNRVIERLSDGSGKEEQHRRVLNVEDENFELKEEDYDYFRFDDKDDDDYFEFDDDFEIGPSAILKAPRSDGFWTPVWQLAPVPILDETDPFAQVINYNLRDRIVFSHAVDYLERYRKPIFLDICDQSSWFLNYEYSDILQTAVVHPVFDDISENSAIVGYHVAVIPWIEFFKSNRGPDSMDMIVVMQNTCGEQFSVELKGKNVTILGETDEHDPKFDAYQIHTNFAEQYIGPEHEGCVYTMIFYPTEI